MNNGLSAFALLEVLIASVIAAASFIFALAAVDYNNRQAEIYNLYSSVVERSSEFNDLFLLQARRGVSNPTTSVAITGANNTNCSLFSQLYGGTSMVSLCRDVSADIKPTGSALLSRISLTYSADALWGQNAQILTIVNSVPSTSQMRSSRYVIPWGN